eukprot:SAG11_NODE_35244_length_267_cov_1.220238_1_plen_70_part_10
MAKPYQPTTCKSRKANCIYKLMPTCVLPPLCSAAFAILIAVVSGKQYHVDREQDAKHSTVEEVRNLCTQV